MPSLQTYTLSAFYTACLFTSVSAFAASSMDEMFANAKSALNTGKYRKAISIYETMLEKSPELTRVKLDLALAYTKTGQHKRSEHLITDVLGTRPPANVRQNIQTVRDANEKGLSMHRFGGAVTAGVRHDSNANSATSTGSITFLEQTIPLEDSSREQDDVQFFGALTGKHMFRLPTPKDFDIHWKTNAMTYGTKQVDLNTLDLQVYRLSGGPNLTLHNIGTTVGGEAGITHIRLDNQDYLNVATFSGNMGKHLNDTVHISASGSYENRSFDNSSSITTYEHRTGNAVNANTAVRMTLTKKDIVTLSGGYRKEETKREYLNNNSLSGSLGYVRLLPKGFFTSIKGALRHEDFDSADALISSEIREDREYTGNITVGKRFNMDVTVSGSYQYHRNDSNIMNYDYNNNRFSISVSKSF